MKEDLVASKNTLVAARDALMASTKEISRKNNELEVLKRELQESEAKNNQAVQQCGSATEPIPPRGVQTRSMDKRKRPSERSLGYGAYENEYTSQLDDQSPSRMESTGNLNV
uniref:Uncharacterized protein n=1 Tax=Arundo donax TaxID=35708 RepID=A0A0A9GAE7_ARUDO